MRILTFLLLFLSFILSSYGYQQATKSDEKVWERLTSALFKKDYKIQPPSSKYTKTPEISPHKLEKRDVTIPIHPWAYPLISWGFVNKDLNFALGRNWKLYVSTDSLMTFGERNDVPTAVDYCFEVQVSPANRNIIFLVGISASWVSIDTGVTFQRVPETTQVRNLLFHPTEAEWALAVLWGDTYTYTIQLTTNLGKSWKQIASGVTQFDWCRAGKGTIPKERICAIMSDEKGSYYFYYTNDLGTTWTKPLDEVAKFFYIHTNFFTLAAEYQSNTDLYVSADDGVTFRHALLPEGIPAGTLKPGQFVEDDYGVIWIVVNHNALVSNTPTSGNLYVSDTDGYMFTLALSGVHTINNWWDIESVQSMEGTLIANVLYSVDPLLIKTKITWDNGATWNSLQPPTTNFNGTSITCNDPCYLHLFGMASWLHNFGYGPFYSNPHATGMIISTGALGTYLPSQENDESLVNTYFSRDGGSTWDELIQGSTIYEYGDYGGILILASNVKPTSTIYYSVNGGLTFSTIELPETTSIANIVTTSAQNERFLVIAQDPSGTLKVWGIDFSVIHERNCTVNDYESWEPHNSMQGPNCVLGHNTSYLRRIRNATCYTPDNFNQVLSTVNCPCVATRDYECDFEFEKTANTKKCVYNGNNLEKDMEEKMCQFGAKQFVVSSGYRKLPADTCSPDIPEFISKELPCGNYSNNYVIIGGGGGSSWIPYLVLAVIVFLIIGGVIGFIFGLRNEQFRKKFPWIKAPAWVHIGYSNQLIETDGDDDIVSNKSEGDVEVNSQPKTHEPLTNLEESDSDF